MWKSFSRYSKEKTRENQRRRKKVFWASLLRIFLNSREERESVIERAKEMFAELDDSGDGDLSQEEFVEGCMQDEDLVRMLSEN